jgi:hypothetical protein
MYTKSLITFFSIRNVLFFFVRRLSKDFDQLTLILIKSNDLKLEETENMTSSKNVKKVESVVIYFADTDRKTPPGTK